MPGWLVPYDSAVWTPVTILPGEIKPCVVCRNDEFAGVGGVGGGG